VDVRGSRSGGVCLAYKNYGLEVAIALLVLNVAAYITLWILTCLRLRKFLRQFFNDLTHHERGAVFLTKAAATCVLGSQFAILTPWGNIALGLWFLGFGLSVVLSYTFFTAVSLSEPKPSLEAGISGSWLLVIVSTESGASFVLETALRSLMYGLPRNTRQGTSEEPSQFR
jgi:tellurite resistance protein TehA-like permease